MTILRAPRPDKGFQLLRHSVARDERLSLAAHGLLHWLLSYPDDWEFGGAEGIAGRVKNGVQAVNSALRELEAAGYLIRRKRREDGGKYVWYWIVYDVPQAHGLSISPIPPSGDDRTDRICPAKAVRGFPVDGPAKDGQPADIQRLSTETVDGDALSSTAPASSQAPQPGALADEDRETAFAGQINHSDDRSGTNWRESDRDLFRSLVGDKISTDGSGWKPAGTYTADQFYDAFRNNEAKPMRWPGRFMKRLDETDGIREWLEYRGLEAD